MGPQERLRLPEGALPPLEGLYRLELTDILVQAYLEFFAPPDRVSKLLDLVEKTPAATYHAVSPRLTVAALDES